MHGYYKCALFKGDDFIVQRQNVQHALILQRKQVSRHFKGVLPFAGSIRSALPFDVMTWPIRSRNGVGLWEGSYCTGDSTLKSRAAYCTDFNMFRNTYSPRALPEFSPSRFEYWKWMPP